MLLHISEVSDIRTFEPRVAQPGDEALVWAIGSERLHNYLLPRDCPRVTFYAGPATSATDQARFLAGSSAVIAIEGGWYERARDTRLFCYELPPDTFECIDPGAGYFVSREPVLPTRVEVISDPIGDLVGRGLEVRLLPDLWPLHDAVVASTLQFSMIRMRNARARPDGRAPRSPQS